MIKLAQSGDGVLVLASNQKFPSDIRRVEYHKEMKLMLLVYENDEDGSDLMPTEISDPTHNIICKSPEIMIVAMAEGDKKPYGYHVPLVQIGV